MTAGAVRVAYAIRWLELGDDRPRPEWISIVNGGLDELADTVGRTVRAGWIRDVIVPRTAQRIGDSTT